MRFIWKCFKRLKEKKLAIIAAAEEKERLRKEALKKKAGKGKKGKKGKKNKKKKKNDDMSGLMTATATDLNIDGGEEEGGEEKGDGVEEEGGEDKGDDEEKEVGVEGEEKEDKDDDDLERAPEGGDKIQLFDDEG